MLNPDLFQKTLDFAALAHQGQKTAGGQPYVLHPVKVFFEALAAAHPSKKLNMDLLMTAALLHDTIEDTKAGYEKVKEVFGKETADGVLALSKNEKLPKEERMKDSLDRIKKQPKEIWIIKMADRIINLGTPPFHWDKAKKTEYQKEAFLIYENLKEADSEIAQRLFQKINEYEIYF